MPGIRRNIKYLFQFTDVLEKNHDIPDIECKYNGAILFVLNNMMNEEVLYSLLSVAKSVDTTNGEIIKNMLICVNRENFDIYRKNYFKINGKNNGSLINKKK